MIKPISEILAELRKTTETNDQLFFSKGYSLPYGGTQFGDYNDDLGDGRSALVDHRYDYRSSSSNFLIGKEYILKGGMKTAFTKPGLDGSYSLDSAQTVKEASNYLWCNSVETEVLENIVNLGDGKCQVLLSRPTVLRVGTFQYLKRHREDLIGPCLEHLLSRTNYMNITDMFSAIVRGYRKMANTWFEIRFVHGCLNTDNICAVPCAIDLSTSFITEHTREGFNLSSKIDLQGRYSLINQPKELWKGMHIYLTCVIDHLDNYDEGNMLDDWLSLVK